MWILTRRSAQAILYAAPEIIVAALLLNYSIKWFLFFWFIQTIFAATSRSETSRCLMRTYQVANDCKLMAIMKALKVTPEDVERICKESTDNMPERAVKRLEDDYAVAACGED